MKKIISIIVFLLFFATSFHSYSESIEVKRSCGYVVMNLLRAEMDMIQFYSTLKKDNRFISDDVEFTSENPFDLSLSKKENNNLFIKWPIFSIEEQLTNTGNKIKIIEAYELRRNKIRSLQSLLLYGVSNPSECDYRPSKNILDALKIN